MAKSSWKPPQTFTVVVTLTALAAAVGLAWMAWNYYEYAPWTRDGRVRVYTVQIAPEVSGTVVDLRVADNQRVAKGDVLFEIDPRTFRNNVKRAQGKLDEAKARASYLAGTAQRLAALSDLATTAERKQTTSGEAQAAGAASVEAEGELDQANLDLERTTVRSPVNGWVTNLQLQKGGYATAGHAAMTVVDSDSFWVQGYFAETQVRRIGVGKAARVTLMGFSDHPLVGRVAGRGRGISDSDAASGVQGLPAVNPVFTWVRLAQRIPIRIELDDVPCPVVLSAGMTATVLVLERDGPRPSAGNGRRSAPAARACDAGEP